MDNMETLNTFIPRISYFVELYTMKIVGNEQMTYDLLKLANRWLAE